MLSELPSAEVEPAPEKRGRAIPSLHDVAGAAGVLSCAIACSESEMAVGQNQWYYFGVGAPPILVNFSGDWDVSLGVRAFDPWPNE